MNVLIAFPQSTAIAGQSSIGCVCVGKCVTGSVLHVRLCVRVCFLLYLPARPGPEACDMPELDSPPNSTLARISIWHECTIRPLVPLQKALTEINSHSRG